MQFVVDMLGRPGCLVFSGSMGKVVCASEQLGLSEKPELGLSVGRSCEAARVRGARGKKFLHACRAGRSQPGLCGGVAVHKWLSTAACATANLRHTHQL